MGSISIRPATIADSRHIFNWRNDEQTRSMSLTTDVVVWEEHCKWLASTLGHPKRCLLICSVNENSESAAVVRFDVEANSATISINLAPSMRGKGLAKPCLMSAIAYLRSQHSDVDCIVAEIKPVNTASRKVFEGVGFRFLQETEDLECYELFL